MRKLIRLKEKIIRWQAPKMSRGLSWLAVVPAVVILSVFLGVWVDHFDSIMHWEKAFRELKDFGGNCAYGVGTWGKNDNFATVAERKLQMIPQSMPYRGAANPPRVPADGYLSVVCETSVHFLSDSGFGWVNLGPVFGESAVFVNNKLKQLVKDQAPVEFALTPDEVESGNLVIKTISRGLIGGRPGMASLMPLVLGARRAEFDKVHRYLNIFSGEMPLFRLGVAACLAFAFSLCWLSGFRHRDVALMISICAIIGLESYSFFQPVGEMQRWQQLLMSAMRFDLVCAFALFLPTFLRYQWQYQRSIDFLIVGFALFYTAMVFLAPDSISESLQLHGGLRLYLGAAVFGAGALGAFLSAKTSWRSSHRIAITTGMLCLGGAFVYMFQALNVAKKATLVEPFYSFFLVGCFAFLVARELSSYRRKYDLVLVEKERALHKGALDAAVAQTTQLLAHDIRQPLNLFRDVLRGAETMGNRQSTIDNAAKRCEELLLSVETMISDLLDMGTQRLSHVQEESVESLIHQVVLSCSAPATAITITVEAGLKWNVGATKLQRALSNLLINALQAARATNGKVWIHASAHQGEKKLVITVGNTGSYIPTELRARIFEPFFTSQRRDGTGLGLTVVSRIIGAHQGTVRCNSTLDGGQVTEFIIEIPVLALTAAAATKGPGAAMLRTAESAESEGHGIICIVEDDIYSAESAKRELVAAAWEVRLFTDVESLLAWRKGEGAREPVAAVVCDYLSGNCELEQKAFDAMQNAFSGPVLIWTNMASSAVRLAISPELILPKDFFSSQENLSVLARHVGKPAA